MTATLPEQLRNFHITGLGLDDAVPVLTLDAIAAGRKIPSQEDFYPIRSLNLSPIPLAPDTAVTLAIAALVQGRGPSRTQFMDRIRKTVERLEDLIALDESHSEESTSPAAIANSLGSVAGRFLNADSLAAALRSRANPVHRMATERRERCRRELGILHDALNGKETQTHVFQAAELPSNRCDAAMHVSSDPCAAALEFCREMLHAFEPALRALRVARLELEDAYDEGVHEPILKRFRWEAAESAELAALPPVLVVLDAAQAARCPLGSISRVLRSGCPIQVVVTQPSLNVSDLRGETPDLAAIAIAHRDAFVLQGSVAYPDHLLTGLAAMSRSVRPALAVIATLSGGGWPEAVILPLARAWALFTFDPACGPKWHKCFQLASIEENTWTAAHAASLNPAMENHFRILPESSDEHDPIDLRLYLDQFRDRAPRAIPFFLTQDPGSLPKRIAVSRQLAEFCHDRLQAYSLLEQWSAAPQPEKSPESVQNEIREHALREGVELAVARAVALLTNPNKGGKP